MLAGQSLDQVNCLAQAVGTRAEREKDVVELVGGDDALQQNRAQKANQ